jgi:magnesium chelatase family protein
MEERQVTISRARFTVEYPASIMVVAAMNPCPCGYYNHPSQECSCSPGLVQKYLNRISGPLMDRIDIHIEVVPVPFNDLIVHKQAEKSNTIRERVIIARKIQEERFGMLEGVYCNAQMSSKVLRRVCQIGEEGNQLLKQAIEKLNLSARAYTRILKVSRTIADLDKSEEIKTDHLAEAIHYRSLDRENWGG